MKSSPSNETNLELLCGHMKIYFIFMVLTSFSLSLITVARSELTLGASLSNKQSIVNSGGTIAGATFSSEASGSGVRMDGKGDKLSFPTAKILDPKQGYISFKFKPDWNGATDKNNRYFFEAGPFKILKYYSKQSELNYFVFRFDDGIDGGNGTFREVTSNSLEPSVIGAWKAGDWHTIEIYWDLRGTLHNIAFKIDGKYSQLTSKVWEQVQILPSQFTLGSNNSFSSYAGGVISDLKIYDRPPWNFSDPIASEISYTKGNGIWNSHETTYNSPKDAPVLAANIASGQNYIFYEKPAFERVYEGSVPSSSEIKNTISYKIAQNEYETLFFNLYSRKNQNNITVSFSPFKNGNNNLVDAKIKVIKNWWQAGGNSAKKSVNPHYVPELLLSDDISGDAAILGDQKDIKARNWSSSDLPSFPELPEVHTSLLAQTSKQFALIIKSPATAKPGVYTSTVTLKSAGGVKLKNLIIKVEVLPFKLDKPGKNYSIYHPTRLNGNEVRYKKQVEDMAKHGINGLVVYGSLLSELKQKLAIIKQNNIKGQVTFIQSITDASRDLLETNGYTPWYYGVDEPNSDKATSTGGPSKIERHISLSTNIHELGSTSGKAGGKVLTAITKDWAMRLDDKNNSVYSLPHVAPDTYEPLDYENLNLAGSQSYIKALIAGTLKPTKPASYYWQSLQESPTVNRSRNGYYLWNTGLDGTMPYVYQHMAHNPYNDFDRWSKNTLSYRDHLTTYPSKEGPVSTMQWEAYREGIDDVRYLQTWTRYKNLAKANNVIAASVSEEVIKALLKRYMDFPVLNNRTPLEFANDRKTIQNEIIKMKNIYHGVENEPLEFVSQNAISITKNSAVISFKTNRETRIAVSRSLFSDMKEKVSIYESYKIQHDMLLENLEPDTLYYYKLSATDRNRKMIQSKVYSFRTKVASTVDKTSPKFTNYSYAKSITSNSAAVSWNTDEPARTEVNYGVSKDNMNKKLVNGTYKTSQSVTMTGLLSNKTYFFQVSAWDKAGNRRNHNVHTFTTKVAP